MWYCQFEQSHTVLFWGNIGTILLNLLNMFENHIMKKVNGRLSSNLLLHEIYSDYWEGTVVHRTCRNTPPNDGTEYNIYVSTCFKFFFIITASPTTPFPTIMECANQTLGQSCNVTSSHDLSITCTVRYYYPRINLYFRHKSNILKSLTSAKWNNTDWTLNKNCDHHGGP